MSKPFKVFQLTCMAAVAVVLPLWGSAIIHPAFGVAVLHVGYLAGVVWLLRHVRGSMEEPAHDPEESDYRISLLAFAEQCLLEEVESSNQRVRIKLPGKEVVYEIDVKLSGFNDIPDETN